jgi:hypothetical protein
MSLICYLCQWIRCQTFELPRYLHQSHTRRQIADHLRQLQLRTTHLKGRNFRVRFDALSLHDACSQYVFGGYMSLNVMQYYYVRHRKRLRFANLPCVVEKGPRNHSGYFPLEVLEVIERK